MSSNLINIDDLNLDELISSFEYIEKVRAFGANKKDKKRRFSLEKCADLYYAGLPIYQLVEKHGTKEQFARIERIVEGFKKQTT